MPAANKIDSSIVGCAFAEELSPKVLPGIPNWYGLEPNSFSDFGGNYTSTARKFIVQDRQRRQGTVTDLDAAGGINTDVTQRGLTRLLQGFYFANAREKPSSQPFNGTQYPTTSVAAAGLFNTAAVGFLVGHILFASGFSNLQNNGYGLVTAVTAGTSIAAAAKATVAEAAPPATAKVEAAGFQGAAGDIAMTAPVAASFSLTSTTLNFTTLGLNVGEWMFLGGDAALTQFGTVSPGYARISSIAAHVITFDKSTFTPLADTGAAKTIQMFFGPSLRDEGATPANIVRRTYNIERTLGYDALNANGVQAEYISGAVPNTYKLNIPASGKLNADVAFMAMGHELRDGTQGAKAGNRYSSPGDPAISSVTDVYRLRMSIVDPTTLNPTPLFAYVTEGNIQLSNNVSVNKGVGVLGGFDASAGTFDGSGSVTAYFSDVRAQRAVKTNAQVTLDMIVGDNNSGFVYDIPLLTLGGGRLTVDLDKPIMIPLDQDAFKNVNGYTMLTQYFPYLPNIAMPQNG